MINGLLISFFLLSLSMIFFFVHLSFAGNFLLQISGVAVGI